MKRVKPLAWFTAASLLVLVLLSFLLGRLVFSEGGGGVVAQTPRPTPTLSPETLERFRVVEEDAQKPVFRGTLNGFRILPPQENFGAASAKCRDQAADGAVATDAEIRASALNFEVGYLPTGAEKVFESGIKCAGEIISLARNYTVGESFIVVSIHDGAPYLGINAPPDRLTSATIGGRPAVIEEAIHADGRTAIHMRDDRGIWLVSGVRISRSEVIKIAEAIRSP